MLKANWISISQKLSISNSSLGMGKLDAHFPSSSPDFVCLELVQFLSLLSTAVVGPYVQLSCCTQKSLLPSAITLEGKDEKMRYRCHIYDLALTVPYHLNLDDCISLC